MQYVYAIVWFLIGFLLIFKMGKENKVFYLCGAFLFLFGFWFLADAIWPAYGVFQGTWAILIRVLIAVVLLFACIAYYRSYKKSQTNDETETNDKK